VNWCRRHGWAGNPEGVLSRTWVNRLCSFAALRCKDTRRVLTSPQRFSQLLMVLGRELRPRLEVGLKFRPRTIGLEIEVKALTGHWKSPGPLQDIPR
jgi:hypothetical protein